MKWMKKLLSVALLGLSMLVGPALIPAHATNAVYIAHAQVGSGSGANCANALPFSYFNTAANWSMTPTGIQIGPDTTVHECDVINGGVNCGNVLQFRTDVANGTSGHPITLLFETGAGVQCDSTDGRQIIETQTEPAQYLVINGGANGFVNVTRNGTPGAACSGGPCNQQHIGTQINFGTCNHCEIEFLTIAGAYVHVKCEAPSGCDSSVDETQMVAVRMQGEGFLLHDNIIHDCGWCVLDFPPPGLGNNHNIYNNNFYNMNHAFALAGSCDSNGVLFHDNHLHDMDNWDTGSADTYHHDGVHVFCGNLAGTITNFYNYGNLYDGNEGNCCVTAWVFLEGGATSGRTPWSSNGTEYTFNNTVIGSTDLGNGQFSLRAGAHHFVYNNTIIAGGPATGACVAGGDGYTPLYTFENNYFQGCNQAYSMDSAASITLIDFNIYGNMSGPNPIFRFDNYTDTSTPSVWQAGCHCDAHSIFGLGAPITGVNTANGAITASFPGIGVGVNLFSISTGSLAPLAFSTSNGHSVTPASRPSSGNWTMGSFNPPGAQGNRPNPPTNVHLTVN